MTKKNMPSAADEFELPDVQPPRDVVAFNELRSCADLYRLYKDGTLEIQPSFQREVVWKLTDQSKFIDSLIKQLPIPSMCFSHDFTTQKWQVVDGLQRMTAIVSFLDTENNWRLSRAKDIDPKISGKTNTELREGDDQSRLLYRKIQNLSLPITVIRCDYSKKDHSEYLFTIFHRLNSGGKRLNHQEIRNCIFSGPYNEHLRDLDKSDCWKPIKDKFASSGSRFRSSELLLRFFALQERSDVYTGNLPTFLNDYMRDFRTAKPAHMKQQVNLFKAVVKQFIRGMQKSTLDSFTFSYLETAFIGIASNLDHVSNLNSVALGRKLNQLADSYEVSSAESKVSTTRTTKVQDRIKKTRAIFAN